jgi:FAD/FMN-containing dehydrogenase
MSPSDLVGEVRRPGDADWDDARRLHGGVASPEIVVRPRDVSGVQAAVQLAAAARMPVSIWGGGHSEWGTVRGGLAVDLRHLSEVTLSAGPRSAGRATATVSIGGGARWGDVADALAEAGWGLSSGDTASVGVGGLTLGGGIGWMVRAWGLACDQLIGAQLVTADGRVIEVTSEAHPELLWALRGGGGNFGVVTRFDFQAHPLDAVAAATVEVQTSAALLRGLRDIMRTAPPEMTITFMDVPPMDPSAPAGATVTAVWAGGDVAALRAALAPLASVDGAGPVTVERRRYPDILLRPPAADPDHPPPAFIGGNTLVRDLDDGLAERLAAFRATFASSVLLLRSLGGAYATPPAGGSAFGAREATWFVFAAAFDVPGALDAVARDRARGEWKRIEDDGLAVYGNFTPSTDPGWVARMYDPETLARLSAIKGQWDPHNLFSRNHNVAPV